VPLAEIQRVSMSALQRDRAHGDLVGSAQPRGYAVAQTFVENVLENAGERRNGNQCEAVVFDGGSLLVHYDSGDVS
jgi:hypothetical protein